MIEYTNKTIEYYERRGEEFYKKWGEQQPPVSFLKIFKTSLPGKKILEIGFGLGVDTKWFIKNGFEYTGIDPTRFFYNRLNNQELEVNLKNWDIRKARFKLESFDGIWANASLLHLNDADFLRVLGSCHRWLKPSGVLFTSLKEGEGSETLEDGRFYNYFTDKKMFQLIEGHFSLAGFLKTQAKEYHTSQRPWLNYYLRKK